MTKKTERIANYSLARGVLAVPIELQMGRPSDSISSYEVLVSDTTDDRPPMYRAWEEFLVTSGPYGQMLTVSMMRPYTDNEVTKAIAQYVSFINRELWGPRWSKKKLGLSGTVVAEPHRISLDVRGRLHFHILLREQQRHADTLELSVIAAKASYRLKDLAGRQMTAGNRIDVRDIWDVTSLATYLTKDLKTAYWACGDNIFFIEPSGLVGNVMKSRNQAALRKLH